MNKLEMIRGVLNFVVSLGVGSIVTDGLKKVKPAQAGSVLDKFVRRVGGAAIGVYAGRKVGKFVDDGFTALTTKKKDSKIEPEKDIKSTGEEAK